MNVMNRLMPLAFLQAFACSFDPHGQLPDGDLPGPDAGLDSGIDAMTMDGPTIDAPMTSMIPGSQYRPIPQTPAAGQLLSSPYGYFSWQEGQVPAGKKIAGYKACYATSDIATIDEASECPQELSLNGVAATALHRARVPLTAGAVHLWKVRAQYTTGGQDFGEFSEYSAVQTFSTAGNPLLWLRFNEGTGTFAQEFYGSGRDGTLENGAAWTAGGIPTGFALQADGVNDRVVIPSNSFNFGTGDFTMSAWIYPTPTTTAGTIFEKRMANDSNGYQFYRGTDGVLAFYGSTCHYAAMGGVVPVNTWHHVAVTRASGAVRVYLDGELSASGNCSDNFTNTSNLALACNSSVVPCQEAFAGQIDDVSIRSEAVTPETIRNDFRSGSTLLTP